MEPQWNLSGTSVEHQWNLRRTSVEPQWSISGTSGDNLLRGTSRDHQGNFRVAFCKVCPLPPFHLFGITIPPVELLGLSANCHGNTVAFAMGFYQSSRGGSRSRCVACRSPRCTRWQKGCCARSWRDVGTIFSSLQNMPKERVH